MKNNNLSILFTLAFFLFSAPVFSQAQSSSEAPGNQTLKYRFQEMLDKSETYTEYKVIKRTNLSQYSEAVQDSLHANRLEINTLKAKVNEQKSQLTQLSNRITDLETQLATSEELRESLSFLGINFNKVTYHLIVWVIIGGLLFFGVFAYSSYIRSYRVTSKSRKEYKALEVEIEEYKKKSHEKQIKMGRELQTERNRVEELKARFKSKTPGQS